MRHDELIENASRLRESFRHPLAAPSSRRAREKAGEKLSRLVDDLVELLRLEHPEMRKAGARLGGRKRPPAG